MQTKANVLEITQLLKKEYPDAKTALDFGSTFQLLVAVILSAQCTDERVNRVTPALFAKYPTVEDFANCKIEELERMIFSTGFYKNKAKNIKAAAQMVVREFGGEVPDKMEELITLPGVARKTANVVLGTAFGQNEGIAVDTHVARLTGLLGLVKMKYSLQKNAVKIEETLMKLVPRKDWSLFSHLLILHGRSICVARRPKCELCVLNNICPSAFIATKLPLSKQS